MSSTLKHLEQTQTQAIQEPLTHEVSHLPGRVRGTDVVPKVLIQGDIRLRVTESYAAGRPVKGCYHIETEGMQEPLHVIWIIEGTMLNHTVRSIDVEFDVRGIPAGETLTRVLTAQVTDKNGQGCIVHSSIFIQIFVVRDDLRTSDSVLMPQKCQVNVAHLFRLCSQRMGLPNLLHTMAHSREVPGHSGDDLVPDKTVAVSRIDELQGPSSRVGFVMMSRQSMKNP